MASTFDIDPELVRKLAELLAETGLSEIEYESNGQRIRIARPVAGLAAASATLVPAMPPASATDATPAEAEEKVLSGTPITSPMVGTVYLAPEPGAEPFVKVGNEVSEGQTILLIEAMKTYNPVRAPRNGKVVKILVGDTTPVEYGEELMILE